jgi:cell division protein FtsW
MATKKKNRKPLINTQAVVEFLEHPYAPYKMLVMITIALLALGLVMVASSSSIYSYQINNGNSWAFAYRQAIFAVIGLAVMFWIPKIPIWQVRKLTPYYSYAVILLLVLVLAIGTATHGQKLNIEFTSSIRIQPSEFAKLAVVLFTADVLERKSHLLNMRAHLMRPAGFFCIAVLLLVGATGDIGTAIVMVPIMLASFYLIGAPMRIFFMVGVIGLLGIIGATVIAPYRMARFTSWLNPSADPQGTGFQLIHGMQALGSGGILGQGLGGSREKWGTLPEAHTDFIYAVIGEELGLFGTVTILLLFAAIAFIGLRIAKKSDDLFIELASFGIVTWLIWQMMVNIGAVLRIMPITGVPLPLVSYGGSSLIPTLAALGLLMSFALHEAKK